MSKALSKLSFAVFFSLITVSPTFADTILTRDCDEVLYADALFRALAPHATARMLDAMRRSKVAAKSGDSSWEVIVLAQDLSGGRGIKRLPSFVWTWMAKRKFDQEIEMNFGADRPKDSLPVLLKKSFIKYPGVEYPGGFLNQDFTLASSLFIRVQLRDLLEVLRIVRSSMLHPMTSELAYILDTLPQWTPDAEDHYLPGVL